MSKKEETTVSKRKKIFKGRNILLGVIALLFVIMYLQIQSMFGTFSFLQGRDSSLISEIGQIKESYLKLGSDINEVRDFLRMPTSNYAGFSDIDEGGNDSDKNTDSVQLALFKYVDYLAASKNLEKMLGENLTLLKGIEASETFSSFLTEQELNISKILEDENAYSLRIDSKDGLHLVLFYLAKDDGKLLQKTIQSKEEVNYENLEELEKAITELLTEDKNDLIKATKALADTQQAIYDAITSPETATVLEELEIDLTTDYIDRDLKISYSVYNKTGDLIGEIILDSKTSKISLNDLNDDSLSLEVTDISTGLIPFLQKLDVKTFIEKKADEAMKSLRDTLEDDGFKLLLSESGLTISEELREDDERVYYDIFDQGETHVSSIVIEKMTGVINIVQPDGANSENLLFFDPDFKKKTLEIPSTIPDYGDEVSRADGTFNILIAGKHGSLVDTMIFAHLDEAKRTVRMVSVPRDLYYNGRKINSLPYFYGMPELKKVLSEVTGYQLDKYILIDMYSFIDVIDLIGGIDITLTSAVIDPTYRTVDNGVEGTLHYEPGDYHLGGKEALRLARTRHTSSDFARAERQQMIIKSIQSKAQNFGFGDADTIYEIAKTVLSKTETDIQLDEAIAYYFRYQNYEIESNNVMSSGNVLYVPPYITKENCNKLIAAAAAAGEPRPGCENENQAYTLLPKNNNWNIVKWFFKQNFEEV